MNEIVLVIQQQLGNRGRVCELALPLTEMGADQLLGRQIHQVPGVDPPRIAKIELMNREACALVAAGVLADQNEQRKEPFLVPWRFEQPGDLPDRQILIPARQLPQIRDGNTKKAIAGTIFAKAGFEEPFGGRCAFSCRELPETAPRRAYTDRPADRYHRGMYFLTS